MEPTAHICAVHNNPERRSGPAARLVTIMLTLFVYLAQRKRPFAWAPAVDLSDPYVAAALAPMTHS